MSRHLFIGGPADGEWRETDRDVEFWSVAYNTPTSYYNGGGDLPLTYETHVYKRERLEERRPGMWSAGVEHVFVHSSVRGSGFLRALILGYRRPKVET